jgi:hypothetical protein
MKKRKEISNNLSVLTIIHHLGIAAKWLWFDYWLLDIAPSSRLRTYICIYPYQILSEKIEIFKIISSIDGILPCRPSGAGRALAQPGLPLPYRVLRGLAACLPHAAGVPPPRAAGGGHAPAGAPTRRCRACCLPPVFARLLTDDGNPSSCAFASVGVGSHAEALHRLVACSLVERRLLAAGALAACALAAWCGSEGIGEQESRAVRQGEGRESRAGERASLKPRVEACNRWWPHDWVEVWEMFSSPWF